MTNFCLLPPIHLHYNVKLKLLYVCTYTHNTSCFSTELKSFVCFVFVNPNKTQTSLLSHSYTFVRNSCVIYRRQVTKKLTIFMYRTCEPKTNKHKSELIAVSTGTLHTCVYTGVFSLLCVNVCALFLV